MITSSTYQDFSQYRYFQDSYCKDFYASIIHQEASPDGGYLITLDQTYFYPTGGGQEHDSGEIGGSRVTDVIRDEVTGLIIHKTEVSLPLGQVYCQIDWEPRQRNMQHHTGQHLLSQAIIRIVGNKTVSANINGFSPSTIDITADRLLDTSELNEIEKYSNHIIFDNLEVKTYFINEEEVKEVPLRRAPKVTGLIRIVEIDGLDYSACGGTHCTRTGEIGIIKILRNERINNKTRIHFVAGRQAEILFHTYHETFVDLSARLSIKPQDLHASILNLLDDYHNQKRELRVHKQQEIAYEAKLLIETAVTIDGKRLIVNLYKSRSVTEIRTLAEILKDTQETLAILASIEGNKVSIIVVCGKNTHSSAREILRPILVSINGKGGGDDQIAQGGGTISPEDAEKFTEKVTHIFREGY